MSFRLPRIKPWQWVVLALFALGAAAGAYLVLRALPYKEWIDSLSGMGRVPFVAGLAVLPAVGVPVMPFYLLAGKIMGGNVPAIIGCVVGISLNIALSYVLGRWLLHPIAERFLAWLGYRIPVVRPEDRWAIALLLRITPGPPFFVQSYLLALAGMPFGIYMTVSVAVSSTYVVGFVVLGESLMQGRTGGIVLGVAMVIAVALVVRFVRKTLSRRMRNADVAESAGKTPATRAP